MKHGDIDSQGTITPLPSDFSISGQAQGDILYYNGSNWVRLAPGTNGQHLKTQGAAANPAWETIPTPTDLNIASQAQGDILYYNGSNWVRLPAGTSGQVLKTNGAGANPAWIDPPAGGGAGNVIFCWTGYEETNLSSSPLQGVYHGNVFAPDSDDAGTSGLIDNHYLFRDEGGQVNIYWRFRKVSSITNLVFNGRLGHTDRQAGTAFLDLYINAVLYSTISVTTNGFTWAEDDTVDVSGLTNNTTYDAFCRLRGSIGNRASFCSAIMVFAE